jgi:hypothetical protein
VSIRPPKEIPLPRFPFRTTVIATAAVVTVGVGAGSAYAAMAAGTSAPASASAPAAAHATAKLARGATLAQIQAKAVTAIDARVASLNTAIAEVQQRTDLGGDQAVLLHTLQAQGPALEQLGAHIKADTTTTAARTDYEQISSGFRVYALVLPVTHLVTAIGRLEHTSTPKLTADAAKIAAKITPADQATVQPLLNDLANQVAAAETATKSLPSTLESYTPSQWNANHNLLVSAHTSISSARSDLAKARQDAKKAAADVRTARGSKAAATSSFGVSSPA